MQEPFIPFKNRSILISIEGQSFWPSQKRSKICLKKKSHIPQTLFYSLTYLHIVLIQNTFLLIYTSSEEPSSTILCMPGDTYTLKIVYFKDSSFIQIFALFCFVKEYQQPLMNVLLNLFASQNL